MTNRSKATARMERRLAEQERVKQAATEPMPGAELFDALGHTYEEEDRDAEIHAAVLARIGRTEQGMREGQNDQLV